MARITRLIDKFLEIRIENCELLYVLFYRLITGEGLKLFERNSENVVNQIHEENITKLSQMSSEDIVQEQHKLEESLDAKILAFLRKRSKSIYVSCFVMSAYLFTINQYLKLLKMLI